MNIELDQKWRRESTFTLGKDEKQEVKLYW